MKKIYYTKRVLNELTFQYNRYSKKINRLKESGRNLRRQLLLLKKITRINEQLLELKATLRIASSSLAILGGMLFTQSNNASAQLFDASSTNPFSLVNMGSLSNGSFADLDNDGDYDMMSCHNYGDFYYFENTGSASSPSFAAANVNTFSLSAGIAQSKPSFVDLDNDGDYDLMTGNPYANLVYYENIGTNTVPNFAGASTNPFSLSTVSTPGYPPGSISNSFGDLDNDGDFDLLVQHYGDGEYVYFENIGTASVPNFAAAQYNPFSLTSLGGTTYPNVTLVDLDNDGDLDVISGEYFGDFKYFQNTGNSSSPSFVAVETNPFSLTDIGNRNFPSIADLDGDGDLDILSGSMVGDFFYFKNKSVNNWLGTTNSDWNTASNWEENIVPTNGSRVFIANVTNDPIIDQIPGTPAICSRLTINVGGILNINPAKALTVSGNIINNGTLTLNSDATGTGTLLNSGTISGSGTFNAELYLTGTGGATPNGRRWYVSSPFTNATSACVDAAGTDKLFYYDEPTFAYTEITTNIITLNPTQGYVFRGGANTTETFTGTTFTTGDINSGGLNYTGAVANTGYNLVGNPYPSFFDWESATLNNVSTTYTIKTVNGTNVPVNDTYNGTSHVGTNNNGSGALTQYIAPNQGFWASSTVAGGEIGFVNVGRSHQAASLKSMENSLIRLNLTNGITSDQLVINVNENGDNNFEVYDSEKMFINTISEVYARVEDKKLIINTLPDISVGTVIPVSLQIVADGEYSFDMEEISGLFSNFNVYIEDKFTQTVYDLSLDDIYTFNTIVGESTDRFNLLFTYKNSSSASIVKVTEIQKIVLYNINRIVHVNLNDLEKGEANVYDVIGKKVETFNLNNTTNQFLLQTSPGVYTIEVISGSCRKIQKIIIQ